MLQYMDIIPMHKANVVTNSKEPLLKWELKVYCAALILCLIVSQDGRQTSVINVTNSTV